MKSGQLELNFAKVTGGLCLASILDNRVNDTLFQGKQSLFRVKVLKIALNEETELDSLSGWGNVTVSETDAGMKFVFSQPQDPALAGFTVEMNAVKNEELSRISWEMLAKCRNRDLSVMRFDPPALAFDAQDDTMLFTSEGPGQSIPFPKGTEADYESPYPCIWMCMQYMAAWRTGTGRGIYYGLHDPLPCHKDLAARQHNGLCSLESQISAKCMGEPNNNYTMDGCLVWQLFDGDWYDATLIYRDFVMNEASWFNKIPLDERKDTPEWMRKVSFWLNCNMDTDPKWMEHLFEAVDYVGVKAAVHMYNWHQIPFDTNYPHYKPAKDEFLYKLPIVQARGIKVMPYINGRIWDTHDRGDYDYQFTKVALPNTAKDRAGKPYIEVYFSKNTKGEPVELATMCPSTALWQNKQIEINNWLLNEMKVDSVYIDQIAAGPVVDCMDKTHPHKPGGGSWWFEHYINFLDHLNEIAPADTGFTTESNGEAYVGHIGGMLSWRWDGFNNVPAFTVVYSGYQMTFGRCYHLNFEKDEVGYRVLTAQSLCFGDAPGWIEPEIMMNSPYRDFFRDVVRTRDKYVDWLTLGRPVRPPKITGEIPYLKSGKLNTPGVLSALWLGRDGRKLQILVNMTEEEVNFTSEAEGYTPKEYTMKPLEIRTEIV